MKVVVDRGQVVKDIERILARFLYLFGMADHREVPWARWFLASSHFWVNRTTIEICNAYGIVIYTGLLGNLY